MGKSRSKHTNKRQQGQGQTQYSKKDGESRSKKGRNEERRRKTDIAAEIEQQLRRQREQQPRKPPDSRHHSTEEMPKRDLGSYVYDDERRAYFPKSHQMLKRRRQNMTTAQFPLPRMRYFPYQTIRPKQNCLSYQSNVSGLNFYKALMCSSPAARQVLLSEWTGRMRIVKQTWNVQTWPQHAVTHLNNWGSPPWCRSFDVLEKRAATGSLSPVFLNVFDGNAYLNSYPVHGADAINNNNPFPTSNHYYSVRFLRDRFEDEFFAVALESSVDNDKSYLTAVRVVDDYPEPTTVLFATALPVQVNDVIRMPHSKKLLVVANYDQKYQARPWLDGEICTASSSSRAKSRFPKSDVLCVEALCPQRLQQDIAVLGHRNGQTSLYDPRCADACTTVTAPDRTGFGNVVQLHCTFSPYSFVARGGNHGTCRLFDIRQASSGTSSSNVGDVDGGSGSSKGNYDPMVVHDWVLPPDTNLKKTARCRGITTVLDGNVILSPYFKKSESLSIEEGHLGAWCLYSGQFLGSKQVMAAGSEDWSWIELCPTLTHLWEPDTIEVSSQGACRTSAARRMPGIAGFWMRCWNRESSELVCAGIKDLL